METISLAECSKVGYLQKPHGVRGEIILVFEEEFEESIESSPILFVKIDGLLVPFFVENQGLQIKSARQAYIKFRWVDSGEKAREYSGNEVYLKSSDIIKNAVEFTVDSLKDFMVINSQKMQIGLVTEVNDYSGNVVLTINYLGREVLIPYSDELIEYLNKEKKIIQLQISDGLLDPDED